VSLLCAVECENRCMTFFIFYFILLFLCVQGITMLEASLGILFSYLFPGLELIYVTRVNYSMSPDYTNILSLRGPSIEISLAS
jgi:hypothetical protein